MTDVNKQNDSQIYNLATKNAQGITKDGAAIGLTMVTAPALLQARDAFKSAGNDVGKQRNKVREAYRVLHPAMAALYVWLLSARSVISGRIGDAWSAAWAEAGWPGPSTAVPQTVAGQISLGASLDDYYTANPSYEVESMNITAAKAAELTAAASAGQEGVANAEAALKDAMTLRRTKRQATQGLMSDLLANLNRKLAKNDPRWLDFGLRVPADRRTPEAPTNLRATVMGDKLVLECDVAPLATRYRFRRKIVGVDTQFSLVASSQTPLVMLEGMAKDMAMEFIAQAVNGNAQSVSSASVFVTVPGTDAAETPAAAKPAVSEAELAPLAAIVPNGTRNGNGNGNGSHAVSRLS